MASSAEDSPAWTYRGWAHSESSHRGELVEVEIPWLKGSELSNGAVEIRTDGFEKPRLDVTANPSERRTELNSKKDSVQASMIDAFVLANKAREYFSQQMGFEELAKEHQLYINVIRKGDEADSCSAESGDSEISFSAENKKCWSTVEPKAFFHEYTHYVDRLQGGESDNDLSEGLADMVAVFYTGSSRIEVLPLKSAKKSIYRDCSNSIKFNYKKINSPDPDIYYRQGQAWCGFAWDAREALIKKYGEKAGQKMAEDLFLSPLRYDVKTIPEAIERVFYQQTPDGFFSHGGDFDILKSAAEKHGFKVGETAENI